MKRLLTSTRDFADWRERLANPDRQWKRGFSAFETAVSWENATRTESGLPAPLADLLRKGPYGDCSLMLGVAEHQVALVGGRAASQCDVWAIIKTSVGMLSLAVEAKAKEAFGDRTLEDWLQSGKSARARENRKKRWEDISARLPAGKDYRPVRYQLLHRCAAATIEAERFGFPHAAFVVQAFETPEKSFQDYARFCEILGIRAARADIATISSPVGQVTLSVGWCDCRTAEAADVAGAV